MTTSNKPAQGTKPLDPTQAERSTDLTWRRIAIELGRVHAVTLTGSAGSVVHVTPLNTTQTGILAACKVTPPPTVTTLTPA